MRPLHRVDPRRPATVTAAGLRRIVLGGTEGERGVRPAPASPAAARRPRLTRPATGCLMVITQADHGGIDEHAREAIAAAALLAQGDEAVVAVVVVPDPGTLAGPGPQLDAAALAIDRLEVLPLAGPPDGHALAEALGRRWQQLAPRWLLLPDRGDDAGLGRRIAAAHGLRVASSVVEIADGRARVRDLGDAGRPGGDATAPLHSLDLLLLGRHVARTELPFLGLGERLRLPACLPLPTVGIADAGGVAGQAQRLSLEEADFILAAGNGVTDVALFHELAEALGAAVGASRVAVDDGRFPRSQQIGATGRSVQARGYLALGISGAVQHLQGIRECRHVMAVNNDPAAPIAKRSELTVADDVQALMRALLALVRAAPASSEAAR